MTRGGPRPTKRGRKQKEHEETIQDKLNEIAAAELDAKLNEIHARATGPKMKSRLEQKTAEFEADFDVAMGIPAHARKRLAQMPEEVKNDPVARKQYEDAIASCERKYGTQ